MQHTDSIQDLCEVLVGPTGRESSVMRLFEDRRGLLDPSKTFEDYNIGSKKLTLILRFGGSAELGGLPLPDPVPWNNDPIPEYLITRYKPDKDAIFEAMIAEMEAKLNGGAAASEVEQEQQQEEAAAEPSVPMEEC